jgi:hypothetical protein
MNKDIEELHDAFEDAFPKPRYEIRGPDGDGVFEVVDTETRRVGTYQYDPFDPALATDVVRWIRRQLG